MLLLKLDEDEVINCFWSVGSYVHKEIRNIIPTRSKNNTEMSEMILLAAEEMLKELMSLDNLEDTRFSDTLSLYNKSL